MKKLVILVVVAVVAGWGTSSPLAARLGGTPVFVAHRDARTLLEDPAAVAAFARFQTAMAPFARANATEIHALSNPAGGWRKVDHRLPPEAAGGQDPTALAYRRHRAEALARAGLTPAEARVLSSALGQYIVALHDAHETGDQATLASARAAIRHHFGDAALRNAIRHEAALMEAAAVMPHLALGR